MTTCTCTHVHAHVHGHVHVMFMLMYMCACVSTRSFRQHNCTYSRPLDAISDSSQRPRRHCQVALECDGAHRPLQRLGGAPTGREERNVPHTPPGPGIGPGVCPGVCPGVGIRARAFVARRVNESIGCGELPHERAWIAQGRKRPQPSVS